MRPFGRCHRSFLTNLFHVYLGALTISLKICFLFSQLTVEFISQKSSHIYFSLHLSGVVSVERLIVCQYIRKNWDHGFVAFSMASTKSTMLAKP